MAQHGHRPSTLRVGGWLHGLIRADKAPADQAAVTELILAVADSESTSPTSETVIDATPPADRPRGTPRRGRRRAPRKAPHLTKVIVAAVVTGAVAAGTPLLLSLGSGPPAPQYLQPAPTLPWPAPETPVPEVPQVAVSSTGGPSATAGTTAGPAKPPPAPPGTTPSSLPNGGPPVDPPPLPLPLPLPPPPPAPEPEPVNLASEAESHAVSGSTRPRSNSAASGGTVVGWVGNGSSNTLRLAVTVPDASTYNVTLYYISAGSRQAVVRINGGSGDTKTFPATGDWSTVAALTLQLDLRAGSNTIELGNPSAYGPDFDRVTVTR
jgi:hypothetical protein